MLKRRTKIIFDIINDIDQVQQFIRNQIVLKNINNTCM